MSLPLPAGPTSTSTRSCLYSCLNNFGWFVCGILSVIIILQIQDSITHPPSPFSQRLDTSPPKAHAEEKHKHKPAAQPPQEVHQDAAKGRTWDSFDHAFAFGDSYTSLGFDPHKQQPFRENPFGNRQHGSPPNWLQFLTRTHNATFMRTYDFAVGGSTVDREIVTPYLMGTTFKEQYNQKFHRFYTGEDVEAEWDPDRTLFFMWFGVNDLFMSRGRGISVVSEIMESYQATSEKLIADGARHLIFLTVPPFERAADLDAADIAAFSPFVTAMNSRIFEMRTNLRNQSPDVDVAIFDAYTFWIRVMDGPADFEETKTVKYTEEICRSPKEDVPFPEKAPHEAECADGLVREYLWYSIHGTFPMHNATAKHITTDCFGAQGRSGYCS